MNRVSNITERPVVSHVCKVMSVIALSKDTFRVELQSPVDKTLGYYAGQYLQLELDLNSDGTSQSLLYSIANTFDPEQPRLLQIFIQSRSEFTDKICKHLSELNKKNADAKVMLPMGRAFLQTDLSLPHLLIAAGSGISKIKCIAEEIVRQQPNADVKIYWSNKNIDDFYLLDELQGWVNKHKKLHFTPILESVSSGWPGQSGYIYEVIQKDFKDLDCTMCYLCGSPQMVYGTIDKLKPNGLKEKNCYSDAFEYAPRNQTIAMEQKPKDH